MPKIVSRTQCAQQQQQQNYWNIWPKGWLSFQKSGPIKYFQNWRFTTANASTTSTAATIVSDPVLHMYHSFALCITYQSVFDQIIYIPLIGLEYGWLCIISTTCKTKLNRNNVNIKWVHMKVKCTMCVWYFIIWIRYGRIYIWVEWCQNGRSRMNFRHRIINRSIWITYKNVYSVVSQWKISCSIFYYILLTARIRMRNKTNQMHKSSHFQFFVPFDFLSMCCVG